MEPKTSSRSVCLTLLFLTLAHSAVGQDVQPIEYSVEQYEQLRQELLKPASGAKLPVPNEPADQGLFVAHEGTYKGRSFYGSLGGRSFLVCILRIANRTPGPFEFKTSTIDLRIGGRTIGHKQWPRSLSTSQIRVNDRRLSSIKTPDVVSLEPGEVKEVVATFLSLPEAVATTELVVTVGGLPQPVKFDLFEIGVRKLALGTERIGPRDCLGVLTIEGVLDSVNAVHLVNEMERLSTAGSTRMLIQWHPNSPRVLDSVRRWLTQAATSVGRGSISRGRTGFPELPQGVTELHLAPFGGSTKESRYVTNNRIYRSREEAFISSIETAYQRLPLDELIRDAQDDNLQVRAAAIRGGAGRLPVNLMPDLVQYVSSDDEHLRRASVVALAAFPSEEAVQAVAQHVGSDDEQLAEKAIRGLRDSRFPIGRKALAEALQKAPPEKREKIARVLMAEVRPEWKELYYEYASRGGDDLARRAVQALRKTGHPKLNTLFEQLLSDTSAAIRTEVFQELSTSRDPEAQAIAKKYTLEFIKESVPRSEMLVLIERMGCREAIPSLQKHYKTQRGNRQSALLRTILKISDDTTVPFLLECYKKASDITEASRKAEILQALQSLRVPNLLDLAKNSLQSNNGTLIQTASKILADDASDESVRLIGTRLMGLETAQTRDTVANPLMRSLATIGTPEARKYLRLVSNGDSESRRRTAKLAIEGLWRYSPALELRAEAARLVDSAKGVGTPDGKAPTGEEKKKIIASAEKVFIRALEVDPWCPEIYISRGHMKTHDNRRAEGIKDFDKALELDPYHPIATSLKAIGVVVLGDPDAGLSMIEDNRERFRWDSIFNYNAACAYGQAIQTTPNKSENLEQIAQWQNKALGYLDRCVNHVPFDGLADMDSDPDLKPLYSLPRFKELMEQLKPAATGDEEDEG
ncbi:MAG: HEAT repeat domain-containing protein [Planctomycetaceae bacterium]